MVESEFQPAFERYKDPVYRFAWRMTNSSETAEDITQEVFLTLLRQPGRFDAMRGEMRSFLLGIARNPSGHRAKPFWASRETWCSKHFGGTRIGGVRWTKSGFIAQPVDLEGGEIAELVGQAVQDLPPLQREVLVLSHYEGLSLEEIARTVGAVVGTVKSRLHRARENLRRMLAPLKGAATTRP